jgi:hypothetical protein
MAALLLLMVFRSSHGQTGNDRIWGMSLTLGKTAALAHWTWTNTFNVFRGQGAAGGGRPGVGYYGNRRMADGFDVPPVRHR